MSSGLPIFSSSILPGVFVLQGGWGFKETESGFDTGTRTFLTHPQTSRAVWPQRRASDRQYPLMFVTDIDPKGDESTLVSITCSYKGIINANGTLGIQKTPKVTPGADVQLFTLPALESEDSPVKLNISAPIPCPSVCYEYVTLTKPTLEGVGLPASTGPGGAIFPGLPSFSISFYPDPSATENANYYQGWVMESRTWDDTGIPVWLVRENYKYYFAVTP